MKKKHQIILVFLTTLISTLQGQYINIVKDLRTGIYGSLPNELIVFNANLYFTATDGIDFYSLWEYDGEGYPIKLLSDGFDGFDTKDFCIFKNKLFFSKGGELWSYDGINTPLKAVNIYRANGVSNLTVYHDTLFFNSLHDSLGNELFFYDGINDAQLFYDIVEGITSSSPSNYTVYNDALYFCPISGKFDLWVYNGNTVKKVNGTENTSPANLFVFNNELIFSAENEIGNELWKFNSTTSTIENFDLFPGSTMFYDPMNEKYYYITNNSNPSDFCIYKDTLFFTAIDSLTNQRKLWFYTGLGKPNIAEHISNSKFAFSNLKVFNESLFFSCDDSIHGEELWIYNGLNSLKLVKDISPGSGSSQPGKLTIFKNKLYFTADDHQNFGRELWVYEPNLNSVNKIENNEYFAIYPNPASYVVKYHIKSNTFNKDAVFSIYNNSGQLIRFQKIDSIIGEIDISDLYEGLYIIKLQIENREYIKKLMIE